MYKFIHEMYRFADLFWCFEFIGYFFFQVTYLSPGQLVNENKNPKLFPPIFWEWVFRDFLQTTIVCLDDRPENLANFRTYQGMNLFPEN